MAIGAAVMIGTGPGALVGALIGGLVGTAVGAVIGTFTGYLGSDKLKEFGSALKGTIDSAVDYIKNFFTNLINDVNESLSNYIITTGPSHGTLYQFDGNITIVISVCIKCISGLLPK